MVIGCIALEGVRGAIGLPVEQLCVWVGRPGAPIHKAEEHMAVRFDFHTGTYLQQVCCLVLLGKQFNSPFTCLEHPHSTMSNTSFSTI